ncbi:MAG TPA: hypothetical protein VEX68_23020 [Bryobacteraceae bacterium]|jgi:hypothetical protein|nr:hypothetical protein [Bryobacteraceae bacterium]
MKRTRSMQSVLAAVVFACGMMGSMECSIDPSRPQHFPRGDFAISVSTATAGETRGPVRRASCAVVRYYVARYTAATAEAWARSKGATDSEIQTARDCIKSQQPVLLGYVAG